MNNRLPRRAAAYQPPLRGRYAARPLNPDRQPISVVRQSPPATSTTIIKVVEKPTKPVGPYHPNHHSPDSSKQTWLALVILLLFALFLGKLIF